MASRILGLALILTAVGTGCNRSPSSDVDDVSSVSTPASRAHSAIGRASLQSPRVRPRLNAGPVLHARRGK